MNAKKEFIKLKYLMESELLPLMKISKEYTLENLFKVQEAFKGLGLNNNLITHLYLGIYLGEFIVENYKKAEWSITKNDRFYDWKITISDESQLLSGIFFPCRRAGKFLNNNDYDLISYVEGIKHLKTPV